MPSFWHFRLIYPDRLIFVLCIIRLHVKNFSTLKVNIFHAIKCHSTVFKLGVYILGGYVRDGQVSFSPLSSPFGMVLMSSLNTIRVSYGALCFSSETHIASPLSLLMPCTGCVRQLLLSHYVEFGHFKGQNVRGAGTSERDGMRAPQIFVVFDFFLFLKEPRRRLRYGFLYGVRYGVVQTE